MQAGAWYHDETNRGWICTKASPCYEVYSSVELKSGLYNCIYAKFQLDKKAWSYHYSAPAEFVYQRYWPTIDTWCTIAESEYIEATQFDEIAEKILLGET